MKNPLKVIIRMLRPLKATGKYLFKKPFTVMYPYEKLKVAERFRGVLYYEIEKCIGCGLCVRACPNKTLELVAPPDNPDLDITNPKERIKARIAFDLGHCLYCNLCVEACPKSCLHPSHDYEVMALNQFDMVMAPEEFARRKKLSMEERASRLLDSQYLFGASLGSPYEEEINKITSEYRDVKKKMLKDEISYEEYSAKRKELLEKAINVIKRYNEEVHK